MSIPVLTYHAVNVNGCSYADNDHIALVDDLRALTDDGWKIVPLDSVVAWRQRHQDTEPAFDSLRNVALTFDDGSWFDYYDLEHPEYGMQRSFLNILDDFCREKGLSQRSEVHATSFVISSPQARHELDQKGLVGKGWWGDEWWPAALETGLLGIECHSWDHNHPDLDQVAQRDQVKGDFRSIDNQHDCDIQVAQAGDYIESRLGGVRPTLYAYPWGQCSDYLARQYMPEFRGKHQFVAAFGTDPRPVTRADNIWMLPRYVCGRDWHSTSGLLELLNTPY
jgi:peptidoglycan/xylan/chitin deacetylase (PgdA/CDA1 family)